jgi:rod shape-determining protein MreC
MKSREAERNRLRDQVAVLRDRILALEDAKRENEQLRRQMGFGQRSARRLIPCRAVFRGDTTGWWQTIRLNRGAADGIRPEMPVITADGLIGKTREVSDRACEVLLLTDPNCRVSCRLSRTGTFGILRGGGVALSGRPQIEMLCSVRPARLDYLPREEEVRRGDEVVTSGLGGVFPDGLPVGCVVRGRIDPSGLYQRADIALAADISALDHVFVVVGNHGAAAERKGE